MVFTLVKALTLGSGESDEDNKGLSSSALTGAATVAGPCS